jgi:hypothetical protein
VLFCDIWKICIMSRKILVRGGGGGVVKKNFLRKKFFGTMRGNFSKNKEISKVFEEIMFFENGSTAHELTSREIDRHLNFS